MVTEKSKHNYETKAAAIDLNYVQESVPIFNYFENQPIYYPCFEQDLALGQGGIQTTTISEIDFPQNYSDIPVRQEILNIMDADADGMRSKIQ